MRRKIVVFDFETDGKIPEICNPIQLAAIVIDNFDLNIIEDSLFSIVIQPDQLLSNKEEYLGNEKIKETLLWHCEKKNCSMESLLDMLNKGVSEKQAWQMFYNWLKKYNPTNKEFTSPVAGGANIRNFDLPIVKRLCERYKTKYPFFKRDVVDVIDLSFLWLDHIPDGPQRYNFDTLRNYYGMDSSQAHDACFDVKQEAQLISRYLKLHRNVAAEVQFKDAFKGSI